VQVFTNSSGWRERHAPAELQGGPSGSAGGTPPLLDGCIQWLAGIADSQSSSAPAVIHGGKPDCCPVCGDTEALQRSRGYVHAKAVQLSGSRGGQVLACAFCGHRGRSRSSSSERTNGSEAALP
jgi:hypothetical protein